MYKHGSLRVGATDDSSFAFEVQEVRIGDQKVSSQDIEKINVELARPDLVFSRPYVWCDTDRPSILFSFQRGSEGRAINHTLVANFVGTKLATVSVRK